MGFGKWFWVKRVTVRIGFPDSFHHEQPNGLQIRRQGCGLRPRPCPDFRGAPGKDRTCGTWIRALPNLIHDLAPLFTWNRTSCEHGIFVDKEVSIQAHTEYTLHSLHRKKERSSSSPFGRRQMEATLFSKPPRLAPHFSHFMVHVMVYLLR